MEHADITLVSSFHPGTPINEPETSFPLGCAYLIAALKRAGYQVEFRDYQFNTAPAPLHPETFAKFLADSAPVIGISSVSSLLPTVLLACDDLKHCQPEKIIILGGPGPSSEPAAILNHYPAIDIIVIGEGEETLLELMECLTSGKHDHLEKISGIAFRRDNQVIFTPPRQRISDLDQLPYMTDALDVMGPLKRYGQAHIMMSRGCTYNCTFCGVAPLWGRRNTSRSKEHVLHEINTLLESQDIKRIIFSDDLFTLNRARVEGFCADVRARSMQFRWGCHGRINLADDALMETMTSAGCDAIFYGIESGSARLVSQIKAGFTIEQAIQVIERSLDYFKIIKPSFIWGFPSENLIEFKETLLMLVYLRERGCASRSSLLIPEPLSPLYEQLKDELRLDFSLTRHGVLGNNCIEQFSSAQLDAIRVHRDIYSVYYHFPHESLSEKVALMDELPIHWMPDPLLSYMV